MRILKGKSFSTARIIIYLLLFIFYVYLAYFTNFQCSGCPLCGMTRAVKCLLTLKFEDAFNYNKFVGGFCIIIPMIMVDSLYIIYLGLRKNKY